MCSASFLVIFASPFRSGGLAERKEKQKNNPRAAKESSFMLQSSGFCPVYSSKSAAILQRRAPTATLYRPSSCAHDRAPGKSPEAFGMTAALESAASWEVTTAI